MSAGRELFKLFGLIGMKGATKTKKELTAIDKQARKVERALTRMGRKAERVGKAMSKGLTLPIVAVGAAVLKMQADFDDAFTSSLAIMTDVSESMRKELRATAIEVSKNSTSAAKDLAGAYYFLASAGLTVEQQARSLSKVDQFSIAGRFDLARATDLLTDAQSALGLASKGTTEHLKNMDRVSDVLVSANTLANASVEQFSESLTNKAGAALRVLGKGIEEGAAVLSVFADQGLKGAGSGEALNIVLRDMQRASLKNAEGFKAAGVTVFDSAGEMRNMADIVGDLDNLLLGMSDKQRRATLSMLGFQDKSISATMALLGTSKAIREYEKKLRDAEGTTKRVAEKQLKSFWNQLKMVRNRAVAAGLSLGTLSDIGTSVLIPVLKSAVRVVEGLTGWWGSLSGATKKTIMGFMALAAAIGPVVWVVGKLIVLSKVLIPLLIALRTGTLSWSVAIKGLSKSILGVILVIGSLVAIGWYYYSQWDTISAQVIAIWNNIKLAAMRVATFIVDIWAWQIDKVLVLADKLTSFVPSMNKKIKSARQGLLKFRIEMGKATFEQIKNTAAAREAAEAQGGFLKSVKASIEAAKKKLGVNRELTEEMKKQLLAEAAAKEAAAKAAAEKKYAAMLAAEEAKAAAKEAAAEAKRAAAEEAATAKKLAEDKVNFNKAMYAQLDQLRLDGREQMEKERDAQIAEAERLGADVFAVKELYHLKALKLKERELAQERRAVSKNLRGAVSIGGKINDIFNKFSDNKLARIDREHKRQVDAINASKMSEEQKATAIAALDEKFEKKKLAAEKARARREKLFSLFSIGVNTAAAVVKALPNIALSILVGSIGLAKAAAVATTPAPFYEGALIKGSEDGVVSRTGERNQDELIMPLSRGIGLIVEGIFDKLSGLAGPPASTPVIAGASGGGQSITHLHIGTFIGDQRTLKQLERKLEGIRISENQRKGIT